MKCIVRHCRFRGQLRLGVRIRQREAGGLLVAVATPDLVDPDLVEQAITPRTRAILPVHLYGRCADMDRLRQIAKAHDLKIVEDARQAHGARWYRGTAGRTGLGDAAAFSLYPAKNLGAYGDGGAITTDDDALAERLRLMRNWGSRKKYHHEEVALNSRLDSVQAAILSVCSSICSIESPRRRAHAAAYNSLLADHSGDTSRRGRAAFRSRLSLVRGPSARPRRALASTGRTGDRGRDPLSVPRPQTERLPLARAGGGAAARIGVVGCRMPELADVRRVDGATNWIRRRSLLEPTPSAGGLARRRPVRFTHRLPIKRTVCRRAPIFACVRPAAARLRRLAIIFSSVTLGLSCSVLSASLAISACRFVSLRHVHHNGFLVRLALRSGISPSTRAAARTDSFIATWPAWPHDCKRRATTLAACGIGDAPVLAIAA